MTDQTFDVIVLGAGAVGENAAAEAVRHGLSAAIIEKELVGGECSYWACMPSKALLRPGDVREAATRAPGFVGGEINLAEALDRRDSLTSNWDDSGQVEWLEGAGVTLLRGHARLAGERVVTVEHDDGSTSRLEASRAVIIATGSSASVPPIPGLDTVDAWTSRDATSARSAPRRLAIIGGGVVGVEMAQAWKTLGTEEVTVIEMEGKLLSNEEPFAGDEIARAFESLGIRVLTNASATEVKGQDGVITLTVDLGDRRIDVDTDELLIATGRKANTTDVGLAAVGLDEGEFIEVDDNLVATGVSGKWLYAVGDANGRSLLTHSGKYQARIAGAHVAGVQTSAWADRSATPRVVFTHPQVAAVGLTESVARDAGMDVRTLTYDIGDTAGASTLGEGYNGTCKLVVDAQRSVIVGATFVGPMTGELLHAATVAVVGKVPLDTLWHAIPAFPTLSEVWLRLLEAYRDDFGHQFR